MKNLYLFIIALLTSSVIFAQTPNQFKYQAVLRDSSGSILANQNVTVDISILIIDTISISVFDETHITQTTKQGLINLNIGSKENLSGIDWSYNEYFIEIAVNGIIMGTSQLLSVPYSLHAKTAIHAKTAENAPWTVNSGEISYNGNVGIGEKYDFSNLDVVGSGSFPTGVFWNMYPNNVPIDNSSGVKGYILKISGNTYGHGSLGYYSSTNNILGAGVYGNSGNWGEYGVYGRYNANNFGYLGGNGIGVYGIGTTWGGYFEGNLHSTGIQSSDSGLYVTDFNKGIILKSPNGQCWNVTIDDAGNLIKSQVICP